MKISEIIPAIIFSSRALKKAKEYTDEHGGSSGAQIYYQEDEPIDAADGSLWIVKPEEPIGQLCFAAEEAGSTFKLHKSKTTAPDVSVEYSTDNETWNTLVIDTAVTLENIGDKVYLRGNNTKFATNASTYTLFVMTGKIAASGNIMDLFGGLSDPKAFEDSYACGCMFCDCTALTQAPALPATTLTEYCYFNMFNNCSSLTDAPKLPATVLANNCYKAMFEGCSSLVNAPILRATTLADHCYEGMFNSCSSLVSAPNLPATTLTAYCYSGMFEGCSSLVNTPVLFVEQLADYCYSYMFQSCTSLINAPELPSITLADNCYMGMFSDCTSLVDAPELPAITLTESCYDSMFARCSSLVNAPELPATTLVTYCYYCMFEDCTSLNEVKVHFTEWNDEDGSTEYWMDRVSERGTIYCPSALDTTARDASHIPTGWTYVNI